MYKIDIGCCINRVLPMLIVMALHSSAIAKDNDLSISRAEIIQFFESYRQDIATNPSEVSTYFSKYVNEYWLQTLLKPRGDDALELSALSSIRSRATFARRICVVHNYALSSNAEGVVLEIVYTNAEGRGPYLYELGYIEGLERWLINSILSDTTMDLSEYSENEIVEFCG